MAGTAARMRQGLALTLFVLFLAIFAFLVVTEPLVKWILTGTLVVMAAIVLTRSLFSARRRPGH